MRKESDFLGELTLPSDALYGIHSLRAQENFPNQKPFQLEWFKAMGKVKLACYRTYARFKEAAGEKYQQQKLPITFFDSSIINALEEAAFEIAQGDYYKQFIVPAVQGGAGTSVNMNINEIISNVALMKLGCKPGDYQKVDPFEHANVFQSTNDTVPTALKVATMVMLDQLEENINAHRNQVEKLERECRDVLRHGFTQMQKAVPSTYDKLFSSYNNALSRDWWRVSKCAERIKEVNLGGGATGTGLSIPRFFIMHVVNELQVITGLPVTRGENLSDTTSNLDSYVEVHATLKAHAVNLEKMVNDLRLLASDLSATSHLEIPQRQVGSSIMPGKINPVIPEFVISSVHKVYANDVLISNLCGQGCLELNAYLPVIGDALLESIQLLIDANATLLSNLMKGLEVISMDDGIYDNPAISTALIPYIGYHQSTSIAKLMKKEGLSIFEANKKLKLIKDEALQELMKPESLKRQGYSLNDIVNFS
ncbi:lyase family protein [Carboxylicivirga linearis]|uniref:Aspartate ammonia-lyase n=1 Tax=Carboxylicivirga linearis TaxID=1628157 RepID=A0ABS5JQL2_9BACT|nr:lyase family protein [Carboxylicivirga linearis]MBS2097047.1 aspartate ammonia-lyase [Carboxylicivirga linearis]